MQEQVVTVQAGAHPLLTADDTDGFHRQKNRKGLPQLIVKARRPNFGLHDEISLL